MVRWKAWQTWLAECNYHYLFQTLTYSQFTLMPVITDNINLNSVHHYYKVSTLHGCRLLCNWAQETVNMGTRMRPVDIHSLPKPSDRHERCIVTCKKTAYIFLSCAVILVWIFLLSSHFSKCVCVSLEAHQCLHSWVYNELMEKDPQCAGKRKLFLPGTLFILCLCGNITDFALFFCICSILDRYFCT